MNGFDELNFSKELKTGIDRMKFSAPTEVQLKVIPLILSGKNVITKSYTGSGKTAAFGIPLSERILKKQSEKVLVICPTRELTVQVMEELRKINSFSGINAIAVYGGHGMSEERNAFNGRYGFLCATPGRLLDHIRNRHFDPSIFDTIVLDEADKMLDMGFIDDLKDILEHVQPKHTHLFSATLDGSVAKIIDKYIPQYEEVILAEEIIGKNILEKHLNVPHNNKFDHLVEAISGAGDGRVLVFVSTKRYADVLCKKLNALGYHAASIHGNKSQRNREISLQQFKAGRKQILIATDVASRGLQIDDVAFVINYDVARDSDTHKHRIGRTGRMGKTGTAITFVSSDAPMPSTQGSFRRPRQSSYSGGHSSGGYSSGGRSSGGHSFGGRSGSGSRSHSYGDRSSGSYSSGGRSSGSHSSGGFGHKKSNFRGDFSKTRKRQFHKKSLDRGNYNDISFDG